MDILHIYYLRRRTIEDQIWVEELNKMCREDDRYQLWLAKVTELEPVYEQMRELLAQKQREVLDQYIIACEELDYTRQGLSYRLGKIHGREERSVPL